MTEIRTLIRELGQRAREAYGVLAVADSEQKNEAIRAAANRMRKDGDAILSANRRDVEGMAAGSSESMHDRLLLTESRIERIAAGMEAIADLPDPVGKMLAAWERPNGLRIQRVSVPLGVIGIIYESRPNVTADAGVLCIKSGNACILRGGSDSFESSRAIAECVRAGLQSAGLPETIVQLVQTRDRDAVGEMLTMTDFVDVIIPRGGKSLTKRVMDESRIPTIQHLDGNCHTYIHSSADAEMTVSVLLNAKMRCTGICGATESVLIDEESAERLLPDLLNALLAAGCEIRGDAVARSVDNRVIAANDDDWTTEYVEPILSIKTVRDVDEAIVHINRHGSHHTDAIIAENVVAVEQFLNRVDSAIVLHNTSTQFADGGEFGMGAEIGISTGRLHARGPVGIEQLTTYKYAIRGNGQIRK